MPFGRGDRSLRSSAHSARSGQCSEPLDHAQVFEELWQTLIFTLVPASRPTEPRCRAIEGHGDNTLTLRATVGMLHTPTLQPRPYRTLPGLTAPCLTGPQEISPHNQPNLHLPNPRHPDPAPLTASTATPNPVPSPRPQARPGLRCPAQTASPDAGTKLPAARAGSLPHRTTPYRALPCLASPQEACAKVPTLPHPALPHRASPQETCDGSLPNQTRPHPTGPCETRPCLTSPCRTAPDPYTLSFPRAPGQAAGPAGIHRAPAP